MKTIQILLLISLALFTTVASKGADTPAPSSSQGMSEVVMKAQHRVWALPTSAMVSASISKASYQIHVTKNLLLSPSIGLRHASIRISLTF
jgi:hypothetical protein